MKISKERTDARLRVAKLMIAISDAIDETIKEIPLTECDVMQALCETLQTHQNNLFIKTYPSRGK